jgi:hypothetical protein
MNESPTEVECEPFNFQLLLDDINLSHSKKKQMFLTPQPPQPARMINMGNPKFHEYEDSYKSKFHNAYNRIALDPYSQNYQNYSNFQIPHNPNPGPEPQTVN